MGYSTKQDMIDRFGQPEVIQLTDKQEPAAGVINDVVLGKCLADADAMIDSYLASRYSLPIASAPKILTRYASDITRYFLWEDSASEPVRRGYEDAVKFLRSVADGSVSLGLDAANQSVQSSGGVSFNESRRDHGDSREFR